MMQAVERPLMRSYQKLALDLTFNQENVSSILTGLMTDRLKGVLAERRNAAVLKTVGPRRVRGFESLTLRKYK